MTPEELIEAEAEYQFLEDWDRQMGPAYSFALSGDWLDMGLDKEIETDIRNRYRHMALAHFKQLNEWGVRVVAEDQTTPGDGQLVERWEGFAKVMPLPEAKE